MYTLWVLLWALNCLSDLGDKSPVLHAVIERISSQAGCHRQHRENTGEQSWENQNFPQLWVTWNAGHPLSQRSQILQTIQYTLLKNTRENDWEHWSNKEKWQMKLDCCFLNIPYYFWQRILPISINVFIAAFTACWSGESRTCDRKSTACVRNDKLKK